MRALAHVVHVGFASMAIASVCLAGPRVEFVNNRLTVDGKPFFFYGCWGTPGGNFAEFKRRHFNTAFMGWRNALKDASKAADAGLMVIPYPYAPGWKDKMKEAVQSLSKEDWVLGWNIGDDLAKPEHVQAALKVRDEIRAIDPQRRPIMFDAIGRYEEFARIPDMWCAYAYPLVKRAFDAAASGKPGGLKQYGEWLNRKRIMGRPDGFFWTWAQCHVQIWYSVKYLGGVIKKDQWRPSRFPDGDHLRLIAAHAVSAGARGLMWFVHYYFNDDHLGRDRYARAAAIGCELDVVGPLIAQGRTGRRLKTNDPSVWATPIDFPGGRLICLLKTGERYHYQPDGAEVKDLRVETGVDGRLYQIGFDFKELPEKKCSFELTSWLLSTKDAALVEQLRQRHRAVLPDMARFAAEELEARLKKVEPVFHDLAKGTEAVTRSRTLHRQAGQHIDGKNWIEAGRSAEEGLRILRASQHRAWTETWTDEMAEVGLKRSDFYLLPRFRKDVKALMADSWGPDQLRSGTFETEAKWSGAKLAHDTTGKAGLIPGAGRNGTRGLRLMSASPTIYQDEEKDWVTVNLVSEKIPAKVNDIWEIAGWVRVPKRIEKTERGFTIALFAYDGKGNRIPGYGTQALETVQVQETEGWKRIRSVVPLRSAGTASIAARLAMCGVGEAYLDDVTVRKLEAAR